MFSGATGQCSPRCRRRWFLGSAEPNYYFGKYDSATESGTHSDPWTSGGLRASRASVAVSLCRGRGARGVIRWVDIFILWQGRRCLLFVAFRPNQRRPGRCTHLLAPSRGQPLVSSDPGCLLRPASFSSQRSEARIGHIRTRVFIYGRRAQARSNCDSNKIFPETCHRRTRFAEGPGCRPSSFLSGALLE